MKFPTFRKSPASAKKHLQVGHITASNLGVDTVQTPGMVRYEAISGPSIGSQAIWMGENHMSAGTRSGDHHHGDSETGIFVLRGHPAFVYFDGTNERRVETGPGDYVFVPPYLAHREENPGEEEAVVVLARSTQQATVVNLPGLRA